MDEHRFEVFRANVAEYARRNAEPEQTAVYGPNKFSDLTPEEFSARFLMPAGAATPQGIPARDPPEAVGMAKRSETPESFISPYTTPARQQGDCGSCWAFASAAVVEGALMRQTGISEWVSTQNLLDCADYTYGGYASGSDGCKGYRYDAMLAELAEKGYEYGGGPVFDQYYKYNEAMSRCKHKLKVRGNVTVTDYFTVPFDEEEGSALYTALRKTGPLAVAFNYANIDGYVKGIVQHSPNCLYTSTNYYGADHAVTLVGWGVTKGVKYWVIKNSWGDDWDEHRFEVFRANVAEYARRNAEPEQTAVYGPNKFSDLTPEEFSARFLMPAGATTPKGIPARDPPRVGGMAKRFETPRSFISPYTTPARQNGYCSSCWAFASAAVVEGALMRQTGISEWVSTQNLLDCADYTYGEYPSGTDGCKGYSYEAMLAELAEKGSEYGGGPVFEKYYKYRGAMSRCKHKLKVRGNVTVTDYFTVPFDEEEGSALYSSLMKYGPLAVSFNHASLWGYVGGIVKHNPWCLYTFTGYYGPDHAATLVGWGVKNGVKYWVIKNSWGDDWGEAKDVSDGDYPEGYFRIQRGVGACHLADSAAVGVIVSAGSAVEPLLLATSAMALLASWL
eukprot:m51a1_g1856 hypothetical protein (618) ;mRNA; f:607498-611214